MEQWRQLEQFYRRRGEVLERWVREEGVEGVDLTPVFERGLERKRPRPIVIVGEAPGREEVEEGVPFVGAAGRNLRYLLEEEGELSRERDLIVTNIFPARTYREGRGGRVNRKPTARELRFGAQLLAEELQLIAPSLILLLGESARQGFRYLFPPVKGLEKCGFYLLEEGPFLEVEPMPIGGFWLGLWGKLQRKSTSAPVEGVTEPPIPDLPKHFRLTGPLPPFLEPVLGLGICHHPSPLAFQRPKYRHQLELFFLQVGVIAEVIEYWEKGGNSPEPLD